ncbi:prolipoprotein diacylglyceryl transferase [Wenxinia marina]|uniref:Phosphatidylglycerol--prolipoprotein diacylglyceryl transferase n=1 Tax=Wenxinia marina DSM 24838 TaxID=1123501 RepID=A0A0D0QF73_9RHOB|nr:prolipoprotein diacylglyceryl transferase [Wenxinia marina]KIQ69643.1 Prolipoprotein diacylglyceryl transferase [Wenxinia marina DSM 24838]GGL60000.1 prolipoprotein diacylglyceryl transferase [Wenxinia marina]
MQTGLPFPDISPEVFSVTLWGMTFALRWYALAYIAGILIGWRFAVAALRRPRLWRNETPPMSTEAFESLLTWIIVGIIAGGRLGYVLFYQPGYYLTHPVEILYLWQGGMSFHGGFLGVLAAFTIWTRANGVAWGPTADLCALGTPPGLLLGRLANFVNGELWGRPTDLPWGVIFPGEAAQSCATLTTLCARHPSQLYESLLEGLILGGILLYLAFRTSAFKRPWLISGTFLLGYGLARFAVEFARQPDAQFVSLGNPLGLALQVGGWGLTMGQLLSLPMIAFGVWMIVRARRRAA